MRHKSRPCLLRFILLYPIIKHDKNKQKTLDKYEKEQTDLNHLKQFSDIPRIQRLTTVESLTGPRSVYGCYYTYDLLGKID